MLLVFIQYAAIIVSIGLLFYRDAIILTIRNLLQPTHATSLKPQEDIPPSKRKARGGPKQIAKQTNRKAASVSSTASKNTSVDNATFAREFAVAQKGTDLARNIDRDERQTESKKQGRSDEATKTSHQSQPKPRPNKEPTIGISDEISATATAAADDSRSRSPIGMETDYKVHTAEALRIISEDTLQPVPREAEWTNIPTKSQRAQKKVERAQETRKQRQRQAQKEQLRELKEEADKRQRNLMENQRRGARIARGEPAKNGEEYKESSAPLQNVWSKPTQSSEDTQHPSHLLDTGDELFTVPAGPIIANGEEQIHNQGKPRLP